MSGEDIVRLIAHQLLTVREPDVVDKLTSWESSFVESVTEQFERTGMLSRKQRDVLARIYEAKA